VKAGGEINRRSLLIGDDGKEACGRGDSLWPGFIGSREGDPSVGKGVNVELPGAALVMEVKGELGWPSAEGFMRCIVMGGTLEMRRFPKRPAFPVFKSLWKLLFPGRGVVWLEC
jgi:hypothetical protein